jgi:hypothetical protein
MRDAGFDVSFRDCPAEGGTGGHPSYQPCHLVKISMFQGPAPSPSSDFDGDKAGS